MSKIGSEIRKPFALISILRQLEPCVLLIADSAMEECSVLLVPVFLEIVDTCTQQLLEHGEQIDLSECASSSVGCVDLDDEDSMDLKAPPSSNPLELRSVFLLLQKCGEA